MKNKLSLVSGLVAAQGHPEMAKMLMVSKNARNNLLFQQSMSSMKNYYTKRKQFQNQLKTQTQPGYQAALDMLTSGNAKASVLNSDVMKGWSPLNFVTFHPHSRSLGTGGYEARFRAVQRALIKEMIDRKAKFNCPDTRMCFQTLLKLLEIGSPEGLAELRKEGFTLSGDEFDLMLYDMDRDFDRILYKLFRFPTNVEVLKELKRLLPWYSLWTDSDELKFIKVVGMVTIPNHLEILRYLIEEGFDPYERDWVEEGLLQPFLYYNAKGGTNPAIVALLTPPQALNAAPNNANNFANNEW